MRHRPNPVELRALHVSLSVSALASMFEVSEGTMRTWLAEASPPRKPREPLGQWRARLDEALENAMQVLVGVLCEERTDPKERDAQANIALRAIPIILEAKASAPDNAKPVVDREALLERAKAASQGAERKLKLVGT